MSFRPTPGLGLTAVLAGALGYWGGRSAGDSSRNGDPEFKVRRAGAGNETLIPAKGNAGDSAYPMGPALRALLGTTPVPDGEMQAAVMRVLEEPDAVRRTAAVTLLLDTMSPATADAFRAAFLETTAKSGRRNDNEWGLMLRQYGKVLGREAMQRLKNVPQDAQKALEGWGIADPDAAHAWLTPGHPDYGPLRKTMLSGIALASPEKAFRLVLAEPDSPMEPGWIVSAGILSSGTDGVTAALQRALDGSSPEAVDSPAFRSLFGDLAGAVFRKNGRPAKARP